jgi:hypothetical protein
MKKLIFITVLTWAVSFSYGQSLQKGNLLGLHIMTVKLNSNSTMNEFRTFFIGKVIPEYEKQFQGVKGYLVKAVRGENSNSFGIVWLFDTEQSRDKYFNTDETPNDLGKAAIEKVNIIEKELEKIGTYETKWTDWVVQ